MKAAVVMLALAIGANTAIFSAVNAVLLNSAALRDLHDPQRLMMVWETNAKMSGFFAKRMPVAPKNFQEWRRQSQSFEDWTAFLPDNCKLGRQGNSASEWPEQVEDAEVPSNFFSLLGVTLARGRMFGSNERGVVVVSSDLYNKRGNSIRINGTVYTVIGVLPQKFELPAMWEGFDQTKPEVWLPLDLDAAKSEERLWQRLYFVYARLRPGVTLPQARSEMNVIAQRLRKEYPEPNQGFGVNVFPLQVEDVSPNLRRSMFVLQIAVGFVLLIACANVANLLLVRAMGREREIAIRLALGAARGRIVTMMLKESLLLSALGGVIGVLLASWSLGAISAMAPKDTHGLHELQIDPLVIGFAICVSLLTGIIFGLVPALHAAARNISESLAKGGRSISGGSQRLRNGLVVGEIALALMLLAGAGLMIRSLRALMNVDPGFRPDHLLTAQTSHVNVDQLLERVGRLPGVISASVSSGMPMESVSETSYNIEGAPKSDQWRVSNRTLVTEGFFQTMGIPLLRGRNFTRAETEAKEPVVAIVSEAFARENWPGQDALGKVLLVPNKAVIIGIVGGTHQMGQDQALKPELYLPSRAYTEINLAVRTSGDPAALGPAIEKAVWSIDPEQPIPNVRTMDRVMHEWPGERRFYVLVLGGFAGLALLLAAIGIYGVLAYVVTLRTREVGIRMALGAQARDVLMLVVGQGLRLTLFGVGLGLIGAFALTRLLESLVFGVSTSDPVTFVMVAAILAVAALLASYLPARRASHIDPIEALRTE